MTKPWLVLLSLLIFSPAAAPAAPPGTLTGRVTDLDGRPVAGLSLWAITSFEQQKDDLPPSAVSRPDGSFAIPDLPPGSFDLYACGKGYVHTSRTVWHLDEPVLLELSPAVTLRGQVLGPDGAPLDSVWLSVDRLPELPTEPGAFPVIPPWTPCPNPEQAITEADGRFEIGPLAPGRYRLSASAEGMITEAPRLLMLREEGTVEGLDFRLQSNGSRVGRLVDPGGAPVPSANVTVSTERGYTTMAYAHLGQFRFFADSGTVTFRVGQEGYEDSERTVELTSEETPVELVLVRDESWKTIRGKVAGTDGRPIEGAEIEGDDVHARSAADGSFEFQLPLLEFEEIRVFKEGFARKRLELEPEAPPAGEIAVRLETGAVVTGRVLGLTPSDHGANARVRLDHPEELLLESPLRADGTFRFEHVPPGAWKLDLQTRYRSARKRLIVKPGQTEASVDFSLPPLVPVSGRVLDGAGRPIAEAKIVAWRDEGSPVASGGSRSDGSFTLYVPKGSAQLTASHEDFQDNALDVSIKERPVKGLELRLKPIAGARVRGRLLGFAPDQEVDLLAILDEPARTIFSTGWVEPDHEYQLFLRPGAWTVQAILYDKLGNERTVHWMVEIPSEATEEELDLDLAEAVP